MASIGKPKIRISSKDLKQAVLKKNKSLESKNKALESSLKDKEKELKSLEKEHSAESKKYGKLFKDIEFQEEKFQKISGAIYSNDKLLSDKLKKVGKAEKELCEYEDAVEGLEDREAKLKKEIESLEFYRAKCSGSKADLAGIQAKKDSALDELDDVKAEINEAIKEGKDKIAYYEDQYDTLEEKAKKHEDMVCQFEQRLIETQGLFKDEENKLRDLLAKSKVEKEKADDELQALKNLCNNTEDKYIQWEQKVVKAKAMVEKEEEKYQKKIERGKRWDINFLEQAAKKKLKNKVENIDKAGLSDILNNG